MYFRSVLDIWHGILNTHQQFLSDQHFQLHTESTFPSVRDLK